MAFKVHGIANDSIAFVKSLIEVEMNSATDNPVSYILLTPIICMRLSFK